jgi:putative transposase
LWKKKYAGLRLSELRELRQLRDENSNLKRLVADLSLDRHVLQEIVARKLYGLGRDANWRSGHSKCTSSARGERRG